MNRSVMLGERDHRNFKRKLEVVEKRWISTGGASQVDDGDLDCEGGTLSGGSGGSGGGRV